MTVTTSRPTVPMGSAGVVGARGRHRKGRGGGTVATKGTGLSLTTTFPSKSLRITTLAALGLKMRIFWSRCGEERALGRGRGRGHTEEGGTVAQGLVPPTVSSVLACGKPGDRSGIATPPPWPLLGGGRPRF